MSEGACKTANETAASYLQQLQQLGHEISNAMSAIAADSLPMLRESVAKQEMLCDCLTTMAGKVGNVVTAPERPSLSSIDKALEARIRAANGAIRELNLQYSALLRHSGRSIALLSLLCKSHAGQIREERGPGLKRQTWSCEM